MFEPVVFREQMYCIEESTCNIVETFGGLVVIRRPGNRVALVPLRYASGSIEPDMFKITDNAKKTKDSWIP